MTEQITITGLQRLDFLDLQRGLQTTGIAVEEDAVESPGKHGELATVTALIIVSAPLVGALAGWLLKGRQSDVVKFRGRRTNADGSTEEYEFEHRISSEDEAKPELIAALAKFLKLDLAQALDGTEP